MVEKEKMIFCFYCGKQIINYKIKEISRCPYCGVKLNYINDRISKNKKILI